jgi:hypothetical protein
MSFDQTIDHSTATAWRQNDQLVVSRNQPTLPDRCVKCNSATSGRLRKKYYWTHPAWLLVLLTGFGWPLYFMVYFITRKGVELQLPLCDQHFSKRRRDLNLGWGLGVLGVVLLCAMAGTASHPDTNTGNPVSAVLPLLALFAVPLMIGGAVYGIFVSNVVRIKRIDDLHAWFGSVNRDFLATMPDFPNR